MTWMLLGVALCTLPAVIVLVVVALPHLREGEDLLTDSGRAQVAERTQRARAAAASIASRARAVAARPPSSPAVAQRPPEAATGAAWSASVPTASAPMASAGPESPARSVVPVRTEGQVRPVEQSPPAAPASSPAVAPAPAAPASHAPAPVAARPRVTTAPSTARAGMSGARRTTYRGDGAGDVVSSRSAAWRDLAESSDPATRAAARVIDLSSADEPEPAPKGTGAAI